jgi:hypothetical protein
MWTGWEKPGVLKRLIKHLSTIYGSAKDPDVNRFAWRQR